MKLFPDQIAAVEMARKSNVFILTGPPGTGKSTVAKVILDQYEEQGLRCVLAAPSGKASKRMFECTGRKASTIHKLLEPVRENGSFHFTRNHDHPIEADVIAADEVSMIDVSLMARFLEATAPGTRLILIGDTNQLPSIGPGNVLKDLIASEQIPCIELSIIKRQDPGLIITNCHLIKDGKNIEYGNSTARDFFFLEREDEQSALETILDLVSRRFPEAYKADPLREVQVITPLREKTGLSCKAINAEFQSKLNKKPRVEGCKFKIGDKVIQTKNDYDKDIINGDIGYVKDIDKEFKSITVEFENPERKVDLPLYANDLELAYAVTIHKYQGSEARMIVIPIHRCFGPLIMQRNLLYTAISRAREVCVLVGQLDEVPKIIKRNRQQKRFTGLLRMLGKGQ